MLSANNVIGVLIVESENETALNLINAQFLERLADSASAAITNAQLFKKLQRQQEERVQFVSFIAHELKNPMTSMKGYTDLLMKGIVGPVNDQQSDFLQIIFNNVDRLQTLVTDLNDVTQLEANKFNLTLGAIDFRQIYFESLRNVQQGFDRKQQKIVSEIPDELPMIWGDQKRLVQIMVNFLSNANKYTPAGGTITARAEVALNTWDKEGARRVLHIQIADTGIGISKEDLPKLFREQYFRTANAKATEEPGTGLGMVLTRGLILQHGGQVWVESTLNVGTTFHFTIPLAEEVLTETT
jgi:signal transduction histidine kinase